MLTAQKAHNSRCSLKGRAMEKQATVQALSLNVCICSHSILLRDIRRGALPPPFSALTYFLAKSHLVTALRSPGYREACGTVSANEGG